MKKIFIFVLLSVMAFFSKPSYSNQCVLLNESTTFNIYLNSNNEFKNCFYFQDVYKGNDLKVILMDGSSYTEKYYINFYDGVNGRAAGSISSLGEINIQDTRVNKSVGELIFNIEPTENLSDDKYLNITVTQIEQQPVISILYQNVSLSDPHANERPPSCQPGRGCEGEPGLMGPLGTLGFFGLTGPLGDSLPSCNSENSLPESEFGSSYNLNKNIKLAEKFGAALSLHNSLSLRYLTAYQLFDTGNRFDIKSTSPGATADAGNFNYGAMMVALGFSQNELLGGSAAQQVIENARKNDDWNYGGEVASAIGSFFSQEGDNEGDLEMAQRGANYYSEVYKGDNNSDSYSNSCDQDQDSSSNSNPPPQAGSGSTSGTDGSYAPLPSGGCIGNCDVPDGTVDIIDGIPGVD